MNSIIFPHYTSFHGVQRLASGSLLVNALAVQQAQEEGVQGPLLIFDDCSGRTVEVDTRGTELEVRARLADPLTAPVQEPGLTHAAETEAEPRGRGRPKLGVVPREVTLLPRHWEWLASQPGGASVALRKLVEEARRSSAEQDQIRQAHERAYHFMGVLAGNLPDFEEATRALFANDRLRFKTLISSWPQDVRQYAGQLAFGDALPD